MAWILQKHRVDSSHLVHTIRPSNGHLTPRISLKEEQQGGGTHDKSRTITGCTAVELSTVSLREHGPIYGNLLTTEE